MNECLCYVAWQVEFWIAEVFRQQHATEASQTRLLSFGGTIVRPYLKP